MNTKKYVVVAVMLALVLSGAAFLASCSNSSGGAVLAEFLGSGGSYDVGDFKVVVHRNWGGGDNGAHLEATLTGPANKLAVILKNPAGKPSVTMVSKEALITNTMRISLLLVESGSPQTGTYKLMVKTIDPERIVLQKDVNLTPEVAKN